MKYKADSPVNKNKARKGSFNYRVLLIICGIVLFTGLLYRNSLKGEFLSYDDTENVVNNPVIQQLSLETLPRFFLTSNLYMYTPVTFISYAFDYKMNGLNPFYFKLTNLLLHLINIILVYLFSMQILRKQNPAILLALLFAVHPVNVDSISWISGRSNLLSALFFLSTLLLYLIYLQKSKTAFLLLSLISFVLSLLSKSSGIMLPFALLFIDFLQKRKFTFRIILEKAPYLFISLLVGLLTIYFRTDSGNTQTMAEYTLSDRIFMICFSIMVYIFRAISPVHLSEVYAYPVKTGGFLPFWYYLAPIVIVCAGLAIYRLKTLKRELVFGICFFLINIILTQVILLEDGFMANRYAYLPYIGLYFVMVKVYDFYTLRSHKVKMYLSSTVFLLLLVFAFLSYQRSMVWTNTLTLFDHVIRQSPDAAFAYDNRGIAKYTGNDPDGALADYDQAIKLNPKYAGAFYNRGIVFYAVQEYEKARIDYTKAIELNPRFASSYAARGILEMDILKNDSLALKDYNQAIGINPAFGLAYYNRGILELRMNDVSNACKDFWKVKNLGYSKADELISHYCTSPPSGNTD